jgi:hypothetical protein
VLGNQLVADRLRDVTGDHRVEQRLFGREVIGEPLGEFAQLLRRREYIEHGHDVVVLLGEELERIRDAWHARRTLQCACQRQRTRNAANASGTAT